VTTHRLASHISLLVEDFLSFQSFMAGLWLPRCTT
jgi:hypothetical protein